MDLLEYNSDDETSRRQPFICGERRRRSYTFPIEVAEGRRERCSFLRPGIEWLSDYPIREYGDPQSNPRIRRLIPGIPVPVAEPRPSSSLRPKSAEFPNDDDEYSRSVLTPDGRRLSPRGRRILPSVPVAVAEPRPSISNRPEPAEFANDADEHTCAVVIPDRRRLGRAAFVKKNRINRNIQTAQSGSSADESNTPPKPLFRTPPFGSLRCHICKKGGREGALIYLCQYRCVNRQVVHARCLQIAIYTGLMTRCLNCHKLLVVPQVLPLPPQLPMQQGEHRMEAQVLPEDIPDSLRSRILRYLHLPCVRITLIVTSASTVIALWILGIYLRSPNKEI